MTNLEMHQRVLVAAKERRAAWRKREHRTNVAYWQEIANDCRAMIRGIRASGNDNYCPF